MLGAVGAVSLAAWLVATHGGPATAAPEVGQSQPGQQGPVPVFAAAAKAEDVQIILRGIGSVQAYNTVSVKSRVDGNIVQVGYKEGQFVKAGELLLQLDPRPFQAALDQAKGTLAKDQATLANAQRNFERDAALMKDQLAVTQQQYDNDKAAAAADQATVQSDQAAVEAAKVNLDYATIRSPIDGRTGQRQVDIGNLVQASAGTTLVTVTQMKPIYVTFSVSGSDLTRIREAMAQHQLAVAAFDGGDQKQIADGKLTLVNNQVDAATGMVTLKATFPNDDEMLWPGAFVNAHLILDTVKDGVTVPSAAVQMGPNGAFAYVVKDDSTVENRAVTVVQVESNTALIGKGLQAGDKVVVSGQNRLYPGARVALQDGAPGQMNAQEPEIGPQGVGSTGINTPAPGGGGIKPR
ncbi:MAG: efflux RND transporter periplasmic adaptor subunit [Alphaproteobacteria bacterium]|nr:efflux RND transporter periplasmic adaptor subunit [Alphaproteobacteria bacterium]